MVVENVAISFFGPITELAYDDSFFLFHFSKYALPIL